MDSLIRFRVATEDKAKFEATAERAGQSFQRKAGMAGGKNRNG